MRGNAAQATLAGNSTYTFFGSLEGKPFGERLHFNRSTFEYL